MRPEEFVLAYDGVWDKKKKAEMLDFLQRAKVSVKNQTEQLSEMDFGKPFFGVNKGNGKFIPLDPETSRKYCILSLALDEASLEKTELLLKYDGKIPDEEKRLFYVKHQRKGKSVLKKMGSVEEYNRILALMEMKRISRMVESSIGGGKS
jgi:hypothetical protein